MTNYFMQQLDLRLNDVDNPVDMLVASGDCLITMATQLDDVSQALRGKPERESIETVIGVLLDLQRRYKLVKKQADYRQ